MDRPLLLIDVDGVLAPFGALTYPGGYHLHRLEGDIEVWLNPDHGSWLSEMTAWFDLVWATGWEHLAPKLIARVLGLPNMPVIEFGKAQEGTSWKLPDVDRYVGGRSLAWIDDDLGADAFDWSAGRRAPTLLIRTTPSVGLTEEHLLQLRHFAEELGRGPL